MNEPVIRVYADTSVFGGIADEEFSHESRMFFDQVRAGRFALLTSALVVDELDHAPTAVRNIFEDLLPATEIVSIDEAALALQAAYLAEGILTEKSSSDALHVALATVAQAAVIVSWNFKHIVHFDKIRRYNAVSRLQGWHELSIHSPSEVIVHEDEDI